MAARTPDTSVLALLVPRKALVTAGEQVVFLKGQERDTKKGSKPTSNLDHDPLQTDA